MKKKMKTYYGWFPALFLLTLFVCLPKTVSALRASQPQEMPPAAESVPDVSEENPTQEPIDALQVETPAERPEEVPVSQSEKTLKDPDTATSLQQEMPENQQTDTPEEKKPKVPTQEAPDEVPPKAQNEAPDAPVSASEETPAEEAEPETMDVFFSDTLFVGDSRTVGLSEYSGLTTATFFADVGMSVYQVLKNEANVSGLGRVTLEELLQQKTFGKIHLMLGINELGYDFNTTVNTYGTVVDTIRTLQPDAAIYLGANLHVGKSRSDSDTVINNSAIDRFNGAVAGLADGETIFYLDVNPLFDDESGNLRADLSGDGTHVYGACYPQWAQWLYTAMQTEE